jgi:hypothetical protein
VNEEAYWAYTSEKAALAGKRLFEATCVKVGKTGPTSPEVGQIYYTSISPIRPGDPVRMSPRMEGMWVFGAVRFWVGAVGWRVVAPSGASVSFTQPVGSRPSDTYSNASFWTFAYKNGLQQDAKRMLDELGEDTVGQATHPTTYRTKANTGTCPCCFDNVKLINGTISRHGWRVGGKRQRGMSGMSWHSGPCFGHQYQPFEISANGTKEYLKSVLYPTLEQTKTKLHSLKEDPPESFSYRHSFHGTIVLVSKGSHHYDVYLQNAIHNLEKELKALSGDINTIESYIQTWQPQPLPGT